MAEFKPKEIFWKKELDRFPTLVVRVWRGQVGEVLDTVHARAAEHEVPVETAVVQGSVEVIVTFLIDATQNPTVAAAIGSAVGAIVADLVRNRLGRVRAKNQKTAYVQVQADLMRTDSSYVEDVESENLLEGWGFQFVVRDNRRRRFVFNVGNKCDLIRTPL